MTDKRNTKKEKKKNNKGFPYKATKKILLTFLSCFILIGIFILGGMLLTTNNTKEKIIINNTKQEVKQIEVLYPLEKILINLSEGTQLEDGDFLSYALYYRDYLNKVYPKLDVRKIDLAGICPIGTKECGEWEGMPHTYLIVNGLGGECILDQHELRCIQVIK